MLQEFIPYIETFSTKLSAVFCEIDNVWGRADADREHVLALLDKRQKILQNHGRLALRSIRQWANYSLVGKLPGPYMCHLDSAIESLKAGNLEDVARHIAATVELLLQGCECESLALKEAARTACLISELFEFWDVLSAVHSKHLTSRSRGIMVDRALQDVARQGSTIEDLVSLVAELFYYHNKTLGGSEGVLVLELRSLSTEILQCTEFSPVYLALWATTRGHLAGLMDEIMDRLASLSAERTCGFDEETQQYIVCN